MTKKGQLSRLKKRMKKIKAISLLIEELKDIKIRSPLLKIDQR